MSTWKRCLMVQQAPYTLKKRLDNLEIRQYPQLLVAEVENSSEDRGFNILFNYINGDNSSRKKIPMTAPVINSEKIAMTAPVITKQDSMAFVLPQHYNLQTVPQPNNPNVSIRLQKEATYAVLRFSGRSMPKSIQKHTQLLDELVSKHHLKPMSAHILMRYNSPFAPGFLRRNEIAVEIEEITS